MNVVYLILLIVAGVLLLLDAFSGSHAGSRFTVRLLPLALFCWVLVYIIQTAKTL